ncbi:phytanoyl-CoA dioxygenase family protein [Cerasicoccus fimbriatus]|uniref:phytanoyl-CoA dioxygenase family protein n=1 Tax=Cerasicoccus fimbriatus TaxID=3014554 RepID=UPI0022B3D04D|nr:phytanoyl-CoA dioxygenase family protein [Cerasicoccus sp. TK19100]
MGREKPWHQDKAYFDFPLNDRVVGVWIALGEATVANGCMHRNHKGISKGRSSTSSGAIGKSATPIEDRLKHFGSEGKDVSC